eukprot:9060533-Pyramimonas_sp.AAC.1
MSERIWVGGLSERVAGPRMHARSELTKAALSTVRELQKLKLKIASKSAITCAHHGDAVYITKQLKLKGVEVKAVTQAPYLGVD